MELYGAVLIGLITSASALRLETSNSNGLKPGSTFTLRCTEDQSKTVQIERHVTGDTWVILGLDGQLQEPFLGHPRYSMNTQRYGPEFSYIFTIKDVKFEDTAFYRCKIRAESGSEQTVLAVCDFPDKQECSCIKNKGMNDPLCFRDAVSVDQVISSNQRTVTGLIVCLVIAILIAIGFAVVAGLDCARRMRDRRKKEAANSNRETARRKAGKSVYDDSEQLQLDPNEVEDKAYYNNAGYTADETAKNRLERSQDRSNTDINRGYGTPSSNARDGRLNGTPASRGAPPRATSTSNTPNGSQTAPPNPLDPRNLDAMQFPPNNNKSPRVVADYPQSPGDFSIASGDLDMLKTPRSYAASPRDLYPELPPAAGRDQHYSEPRRLEFINQNAVPDSPPQTTYKPTVI